MTENKPFQGKVVKTSVRKKDSMALSQGKPVYVADLDKNPLIAKVLRSPHAHAKILSIDASKAEALEGVHCVRHMKMFLAIFIQLLDKVHLNHHPTILIFSIIK